MNCKIRQIDKDERFETRVMEISVSGITTVTPSKTIDKDGTIGEINEFSVTVSKNDIIAACENTDAKLNKLSSRRNDGAINVLIPEYQDYGFEADGKNILSKMESRIHMNTDIVVVPRWGGVQKVKKNGTLEEDLISHSRQFIEESRTLNGKLIMGNIPLNVPEKVIDGIVKFYLSEDITSFMLDYGTCLPRGKEHIVRSIQKTLIDSGDYENSILYSNNVRRTHRVGEIFPADDLMTFCHGVDIIGNLHIGGGGPSRNDKRPEPLTKEFIPSEYTYVDRKVHTVGDKNNLKVRNCRMQNEETKKISNEILENRTSYNFIKDKSGAKEYVESSKQKKLEFRFTV